MINQISDLDGTYNVVYQAKAPTIPGLTWVDHCNATVTILSGKLTGGDTGGTVWSGTLNLAPDKQAIDFLAYVDPKLAPSTTFVLDQNGQVSRDKQKYMGTLKLLAIGNKITIYGTIKHGAVSIEITFKRNKNGFEH